MKITPTLQPKNSRPFFLWRKTILQPHQHNKCSQRKKYLYIYILHNLYWPKKNICTAKFTLLSISVRFVISATIRIGQEIQCLLYAGFFILLFPGDFFSVSIATIVFGAYYEWLFKTKLISNPNELWIVNPQWIHN